MSNRSAVFVFAHQDDEILISGKIMAELAAGSTVHLIWCNDGSGGTGLYDSPQAMEADYRPHMKSGESLETLSQARVSEILCAVREREARAAMGSLGIRGSDMVFLKHSATWMKDSQNIAALVDEIKGVLSGIAPDEVYVDAWEGAHITHDITNFATVHAARGLERQPRIFEFPQYPFLSSYKTSILKYFKKTELSDTLTHLLHYGIGQFADDAGKVESIHLTPEQVSRKNNLVHFYVSQSKLTSRFNIILNARVVLGTFLPRLRQSPRTELWRAVPDMRDYTQPPCRGHRYSMYNQGISDADYVRMFAGALQFLR